MSWRRIYDDATLQGHEDGRIAAVVAGVPAAADFDLASLSQLRVPVAILSAAQDRWLNPAWHSSRVLLACKHCVHLLEMTQGGHGALISPLPPVLSGLLGELVNDPPGFDRLHEVPRWEQLSRAFFDAQLLR